ncbi:MAG: adenylate/guanylate cyclase domain-containing protein [Verrucomicrobiota bacterium]
MSAYPTGTVTFLFTDVEGSTKLLHELGDDYASVVTDHRRILRETFGGAGGREVDTQGDAFFYSFQRARDAVTAAVEGQRALAAHEWPHGARVRVRMGLHTGEPAVGDEGYIGLDVVRAARICSAGHGRQVLLSETTRALVGGDLPEGVSVRDLGEQKLKDVPAEHLYQLHFDGSPEYFPMLRTEGSSSDFSERINKHVESVVEAQLNSVFAGGKPPTVKLAGLTAFGLVTLFVLLGLLVGLAFLIRAVFF